MNNNPNMPSARQATSGEALSATKLFFARWWKLLLVVFLAAAAVSLVVSLLIKPLYRSTAVMIPSNSNRLTKAIMDYHYSMDFMDYGAENDCEYALQLFSSKQMAQAVCKRFGLIEHYKIKATSAHPMADFETKWASYFSARRTKYMAVQISVLDRDPQLAADIVNYMLTMYDTLCHDIHRDRATDAAMVMSRVCAAETASIDSIAASADKNGWQQMLVKRKCRKLADMQARATQTAVECDLSVSYKYVIDPATVADKKDRPQRALIVVGGSLGAVVVCIFALLMFAPRKEEQPEVAAPEA